MRHVLKVLSVQVTSVYNLQTDGQIIGFSGAQQSYITLFQAIMLCKQHNHGAWEPQILQTQLLSKIFQPSRLSPEEHHLHRETVKAPESWHWNSANSPQKVMHWCLELEKHITNSNIAAGKLIPINFNKQTTCITMHRQVHSKFLARWVGSPCHRA